MSVSQPVPIIIAAGGKARRMAADKPALMLGGASLIERALKNASAMSAAVAISVQQKPAWAVPANVEFLFDEEVGIGPLSALSSALSWGAGRQSSHVLLIPCDMPFLPADLLSRLAEDIGDAAVAMAKSKDRMHPICALWAVEALSALHDYAENSRRSLIGFAERLGMIKVEWGAEPVDPFLNINTPEDVLQAEREVASGADSR